MSPSLWSLPRGPEPAGGRGYQGMQSRVTSAFGTLAGTLTIKIKDINDNAPVFLPVSGTFGEQHGWDAAPILCCPAPQLSQGCERCGVRAAVTRCPPGRAAQGARGSACAAEPWVFGGCSTPGCAAA